MKVPSPTQGRTRTPSMAAQQYVQPASNPGAGGQLIARGLSSFGAALQVRAEQTDKFNTLRGFSEFQSNAAARLTELKRNYSPDGKGFTEAADKLYGELEQEWLPNVPGNLQEEFRYRSSEVKRGVLGDALKFQYESGDAWFRQGISDEISKSKTILDQTPEALEAEQRRLMEVIDVSDLSAAEKMELKRQATIGLAAVTYKSEVRRDPTTRASVGVGDPVSVVDKIIGVESSGRADAQNENSSAGGLGQFIDSTWLSMLAKHRPDIQGSRAELLALKKDPGLNREMTTRFTEENMDKLARQGLTPSERNTYLMHFLGEGDAPKVIRASPDTPIEQLVDPASIRANPTVLPGKTAGEVRAWAARKMGGAKLDTDPRFESIPYEDRVALRDDAERQAAAEQTQMMAQAKAEKDAAQNALYLGLLDGNAGQVDIDNARTMGILDDYDSVNKALGILKKRDEEVGLAAGAWSKLAAGAPFDPTSATDKDGLNAIVKQGNGLAKIGAQDTEYFSSTVLPLVQQVGDIPTEVAGTLMGMLRGGSNQASFYALDALAQLRDVNAIAFNQRVSDDVAKQVDLWDTIKDLPMEQTDLINRVRGGTTQAERQQQMMLRKEAQDLLGRAEGGVARGQKLLDDAVGKFGGWTWSPSVGAPLARQSLAREFNAEFVDAYARTGDEAIAAELAGKALERSWGVSSVGGGKDFMKYPPEKVGYAKVNGTYEWINRSVRRDLEVPEDQDFDLFSDEQTRQEFQTFRTDPKAPPPSYRVFLKDENGVYREKYDEQGLPLRLNFKPEQADFDEEAAEFDWREREMQLKEVIRDYEKLRLGSQINPLQPLEIPQEDTDAYNAAVEELRQRNDQSQNMRKAGAAIGAMIGGK